jgi:hypothetical protein
LHRPFGVTACLALPLVVEPLPSADRKLDFDKAMLEVHAQGNERSTPLIHIDREPFDLVRLEKELARPDRLMVVAVPMTVGTDVALKEPGFVVAVNRRVSLRHVHSPVTTRFHFSTDENDSRLDGFLDLVVVTRFTVLRDELCVGLSRRLRLGHGRPSTLCALGRDDDPLQDLLGALLLSGGAGVDLYVGLDSGAVDLLAFGSEVSTNGQFQS